MIAVNHQCSLEVLFPNLEKLQKNDTYVSPCFTHARIFSNCISLRISPADTGFFSVEVVRLGIMNPDDPRIRKDPDGIPHLGLVTLALELKEFLMF